jgi:hypothetical protein
LHDVTGTEGASEGASGPQSPPRLLKFISPSSLLIQSVKYHFQFLTKAFFNRISLSEYVIQNRYFWFFVPWFESLFMSMLIYERRRAASTVLFFQIGFTAT